MHIPILLVAAAIVITKALDALTTLRAVGTRGEGETNALASRWMGRHGTRAVTATVFALTTVIATTVAWFSIWSGDLLLQVGYVATGTFVAFVQGAVAHTNATGRWNLVTRRVLVLHQWIASRLR